MSIITPIVDRPPSRRDAVLRTLQRKTVPVLFRVILISAGTLLLIIGYRFVTGQAQANNDLATTYPGQYFNLQGFDYSTYPKSAIVETPACNLQVSIIKTSEGWRAATFTTPAQSVYTAESLQAALTRCG